MSTISRGTTWASLQVLTASALNSEFNIVFNAWNNADAGTGLWNNVKISSTSSNPMECKSSAASCEFDVDCTGTNGTPIHTWRRSGSILFTAGVDGAASNLFKMGTTGLTTNVAWQIPSTGVQTQFAVGSTGTPSIAWIGDATTGIFRGGAGRVDISNANVDNYTFGPSSFGCAQPFLATDGTAGAPSISFTNAATSGFFKGTSSIGLSTGGAERFRVDNNGNILNVAGTLATNATNGFTVISTSAGAPTGVPSVAGGGGAILQYDSTNHKLYVYDAAWKSVALT